MKVWTKNRDYKINPKGNGWWNAWYKGQVIATAIDEEQARVPIYKHNGEKEFVDEKDFESWGDNFEDIARAWSEFIKRKISVFDSFKLKGKDVADMMVLMKECRVDAIAEKYEFCEDEETAKKLKEALRDSLKDMDNYEWIAENYKEYKRL